MTRRLNTLEPRTLHCNLYTHGDYVTYEKTLETLWPRYTLRIRVITHSDPACQSGLVEVWDKRGVRWNDVAHLPAVDMTTPLTRFLHTPPSPTSFEHDAHTLYSRAQQILRFW
jgi:hypothetical protein